MCRAAQRLGSRSDASVDQNGKRRKEGGRREGEKKTKLPIKRDIDGLMRRLLTLVKVLIPPKTYSVLRFQFQTWQHKRHQEK